MPRGGVRRSPRMRLGRGIAAVLVVVGLTVVLVRLTRTGFTGLGNPNLPASVRGTTWRLTSIVAAGRTVPHATVGAVRPTLVLSRHGFAITGDCNDEKGSLSISGRKLTFRLEEGSLAACGNAPAYTLLSGLVRGSAHYAAAPGSLVLRSHQATFTFSATEKKP